MSLLDFSKKQQKETSEVQQRVDSTIPNKRNDFSLVSHGCTANGKFISIGDILIEGSFNGTLDVGQDLIVASTGVIESESVVCRNAQISGVVNGPITVYETLKICQGGVITGDITVADLLVEQGGIFNGSCRRLSPQEISSSNKTNIAQQEAVSTDKNKQLSEIVKPIEIERRDIKENNDEQSAPSVQ